MIIVKLMGGLGNQLFQYAFGRNLQYRTRERLLFDTTSYSANSDRKLNLTEFNINIESADEKMIDHFFSFKNRLLKKIKATSTLLHYATYFELHPDYRPLPDLTKKNLYYSGYWQSEQYFRDINDILKTELILKKPASIFELNFNIDKRETVSLHIRRGDYANKATINSIYGLLPNSYYLKAAEYLRDKLETPFFIIFSDDVDWVKNNFQFPFENQVFYDNRYSDAQALILMSQCKHHIIANSTYSWWAAWINNNPSKIIISPELWFTTAKAPKDLIPKTWIQI